MENYGVKTLLQLTETEPLKWGEVFSRKDANNDGILSGAPKCCFSSSIAPLTRAFTTI
jgi:hypothetical protein